MKITSIFSPENNHPNKPTKRPLLDIALRLLAIFVIFFTLAFVGAHFVGSKFHPGETMATGPSIVLATIVASVMTICLAKSV